jgi:hypothetical protein
MGARVPRRLGREAAASSRRIRRDAAVSQHAKAQVFFGKVHASLQVPQHEISVKTIDQNDYFPVFGLPADKFSSRLHLCHLQLRAAKRH